MYLYEIKKKNIDLLNHNVYRKFIQNGIRILK